MDDLILNFAPTGMIPTKEMTKYVPITPSEIIEQVHEANEIGITTVHIHARDELSGKPTYKSEVYEKIFSGVRKHCPELVIAASLSGRDFKKFGERSEVLELKPDMGSLTIGSLNFTKQESVSSPDMIIKLALKMEEYGVKPELAAFNLGMINTMKYLIKKNILKPPYYINLMLGNIAGLQSNFSHIGLAINDLPDNTYWALAGIGSQQITANSVAIATGGGIRVGLEDNIYYDKNRKKLASNIELIKRIHVLSEIHERKVMKSKDFGNLGFYNSIER
jgi:3-oxoadipate:acetyl-CoA acetyltransferase